MDKTNEKKPSLSLEVLAPYLPYKLRFKRVTGNEEDGEEYCVLSAKYTHDDTISIQLAIDLQELYKPILRPLSDYNDLHGKNAADLGGDMSDEFEIYEYATKSKSLASVPYSAYEVMVRNRVDVFNLIPAGLAIDANTIKEDKI